MPGNDRLTCEVHKDMREDLRAIQSTQKDRDCGGHESRLCELENQTAAQWTDIKDLQRTVWRGVGILTAAGFFGSVAGSLVMQMLRH